MDRKSFFRRFIGLAALPLAPQLLEAKPKPTFTWHKKERMYPMTEQECFPSEHRYRIGDLVTYRGVPARVIGLGAMSFSGEFVHIASLAKTTGWWKTYMFNGVRRFDKTNTVILNNYGRDAHLLFVGRCVGESSSK